MTGDPWKIAASASRGRSPRHWLPVPRAARTSPSSWDAAHRTHTLIHGYGRRGEDRHRDNKREEREGRGVWETGRRADNSRYGKDGGNARGGKNWNLEEKEGGRRGFTEDFALAQKHVCECAHLHLHTQFQPKVRNFTSKPMLDGLDGYLGFDVKSKHWLSVYDYKAEWVRPPIPTSVLLSNTPLYLLGAKTHTHNTHDRMVGSRRTQVNVDNCNDK